MSIRAGTEPMHEQQADRPSQDDRAMLAEPRSIDTALIFQVPLTYPLLEGFAGKIHPSFREIVHKVGGYLEYRRFPRSQRDMCMRFEPYLAKIEADAQKPELLTTREELNSPHLNRFRRIVLLWPDASGIGWTPIERKVFNNKCRECQVYVLNGRGRLFELKWTAWRSFQVKRFLEKSFIPETLMLLGFLITSPFMALWDRIMKEGR